MCLAFLVSLVLNCEHKDLHVSYRAGDAQGHCDPMTSILVVG